MPNSTAVKHKEASSPVPIHYEDRKLHERLHQRVSRRAFEPFEQSGREHGQDLAHWYQAESEMARKINSIRETAFWYTFSYPVEGFHPEEVYVAAEPDGAIIIAEHPHSSGVYESSGISSTSREALVLIARWPTNVDPSTASAYIKDEVLTLTAKRATAGG